VRIEALRLRGILDSRAGVTMEAELTLGSGHSGRGSAPRAIAPGRLERGCGPEPALGPVGAPALRAALARPAVADQADCDGRLARLCQSGQAGSAMTLAVSLAFARAAAAAAGVPLYGYLAALAGSEPAIPALMVNVFSGGIHLPAPARGFQQVMVLPATGGLRGDIDVARAVFAAAERLAGERFPAAGLSASSGLLAPAGSEEQLDLARAAAVAAGHARACTFGVDVAAEHLARVPGRYRFGDTELGSEDFARLLARLATTCQLSYLEDPFDPADTAAWRGLRAVLPRSTLLVGDDLFATDEARVDRSLADGILLKLSQAGTVTATLAAAAAARRAGMALAVSHRSGETEDTAMCDLAVAVGADLIKVGGPRRGDRLAKYNQLLRLDESLHSGPRRPARTATRREPAAATPAHPGRAPAGHDESRGQPMTVSKARTFRELMNAPEILVVPSAYDALSAKVIEQAGFPAVHMTGSGTSASMLGLPDLGFTSMSEQATNAKNIVLAVDVPVIMDADAGYGNAMAVWRATREFERMGIVGYHLEDQANPKRCGHLEGKRLISTEEMTGKIEAAVEARVDEDFTIIARTDAREAMGLDEAIRRSREYLAAGADCIFLEAMLTVEEMKRVRDEIDAPLLANMVEGGKTPWLTTKDLESIGYNLAIYPLSGWMAAASVLRKLFAELRDTGTTQGFWDAQGLQMTFAELFEVFGYSAISDLEARVVRDCDGQR